MTDVIKNDGGPAFPFVSSFPTVSGSLHRPSEYGDLNEGMTLRDYFAGQAIGSVIDVCRFDTNATELELERYLANRAYDIADAMLKVRDQ